MSFAASSRYGKKWPAKSCAAKRAAGFRCEYVYRTGQRCNSSVLLNTHHKTYDRMGKEKGSDLICLCRVHHLKVHGRLDTCK